jgi:peptidoglycan/xylan/chitin deacetylase (PgdA/CDA1 family)
MEYLAGRGYRTPRFADLADEPADHTRQVVLTFDDGYLDFYENALPILRECGFTAVMFLVADFSRHTNWWDYGNHPLRAPLLRKNHISTMQQEGIELGSHTCSHRSLVALGDSELRDELARSKSVLEDLTSHPVTLLSYPYGDVDGRVKAAAREVGYSCGLAGQSGPLHFSADRYEIRRVLVTNRPSDAYMFSKVSGLDKTLSWGRWMCKRMIGRHNSYHVEPETHEVNQ